MAYSPWIGNLVVNNIPGNYGTTKLLLDEAAAGAMRPLLTVRVEVAGTNAADFEVEAFTNFNRRDFAKIHEPVDDAGTATSYWTSHRMHPVGRNGDNLLHEVKLLAEKCGAYRLTARYRRVGSSEWWWHNDFAPFPGAVLQRDAAIVISPAKAATLRIYEANALTVEAMTGGDYDNRSTLDDFLPFHDLDGFNPFQLDYVSGQLGFNALWLMPVFPGTRWRWDRTAWQWTANDNPGSPYAVRDYWSINPWLADNGEKERAMELFKELVGHAADLGLDVFLDMAFNHAGRDVVYGNGAVELGLCRQDESEAWIRENRPSWCTRGNEFRDGRTVPHYREPADSSFGCAVWAPADRLNEHIWDDANVDWYFGDYSALGPKPFRQSSDYWGNPAVCQDGRGSAEDEQDRYYTDLGTAGETSSLWSYFAYVLPYWIRATDGRLAGMRADFAQGLPSQLWEYIVNKTRQTRWDFVFLGEVLDPDPVQYRMNRAFDVLTTKDHYLYRMSEVRTSQLVASLESETRLFGQGALAMHNGTSHDEDGNPDKWAMVARYAVAASLHGVPMIFMGQPLGQAHKMPFREQWASMHAEWTREDPERAPVAAMYRRINKARADSPELTSQSRYFLHLTAGGFHEKIFAVARWIDAGDVDSVVLAFVNLDAFRPCEAVFSIPRSIRLAGNYQVRNLVGDNPSADLWPDSRTAEDIYCSGMVVRFGLPNEVQYLRLSRL